MHLIDANGTDSACNWWYAVEPGHENIFYLKIINRPILTNRIGRQKRKPGFKYRVLCFVLHSTQLSWPYPPLILDGKGAQGNRESQFANCKPGTGYPFTDPGFNHVPTLCDLCRLKRTWHIDGTRMGEISSFFWAFQALCFGVLGIYLRRVSFGTSS